MNWTLFNNHCYKYFQDQLRGYSEAKAQCETFGASLATIHSKEENDYLWSLFSQSGHNVWVGGNDEAVDGSWVWEDGMAWGGFTLWDSVEPNGGSSENCLEIQRKNGKWNDISCTLLRYYICKNWHIHYHRNFDTHARILLNWLKIVQCWCFFPIVRSSQNILQNSRAILNLFQHSY